MYDLTSTYFEGAGPAGFAVHGYSRDGRPRNWQVLVGVVMINGWPIAHHVFRGNLHDDQNVADVLADLERRFGIKRRKELSEVERAFRELKDLIELRPIYHRRKERVQAHIFVAALAFLLDRAIEKKLKAGWRCRPPKRSRPSAPSTSSTSWSVPHGSVA